MLTEIKLKTDRNIYKELAEKLSHIVNKVTPKPEIFLKEEYEEMKYSDILLYLYGSYEIKFMEKTDATLDISISGDRSTKLNQPESQKVIELLEQCAEEFLKKNKFNYFVSLYFYGFSEEDVDIHGLFSPYGFADFEMNRWAIPLSNELKELQNITFSMNDHFPIRHSGRQIETGYGKFRKMYGLEVLNVNGVAKIGVFHDGLIHTLENRAELRALVDLKEKKMKELKNIKEDAIKTLKAIDPTFKYDGKTGVELYGNKLTINTEYDVFKDNYLMVFLKSKIKTKTLAEMEEKVAKFIVKKTT